jgi:hypothetical protein
MYNMYLISTGSTKKHFVQSSMVTVMLVIAWKAMRGKRSSTGEVASATAGSKPPSGV